MNREKDNDRRNHRKRWRRDDENYIREHPHADNKVLAVKFGRTEKAIKNIKQKLKWRDTTN